MVAIYKTETNGLLKIMVDDTYKTKQDFIDDIRMNGFIAVCVLTDKDIRDIKTGEIYKGRKILKYSDRVIEYVKEFI